MKETKEEELEEAKGLLKDGLVKIFQATGKISREIIKGFKEGYTDFPFTSAPRPERF